MSSTLKSATVVMLTREEVCQMLKMKPSRLYYLTSTEQIPHLKFGGTLRFEQEAILRWIEQHRRGPSV